MSGPRAVFLGWVALIGPQSIAGLLSARHVDLPAWVIAASQLRAALHVVLLGLICAAIVAAWQRLAPRPLRTHPIITASAIGAALAFWLVLPDAGGFLDRERAAGSAVPWAGLLVVAGALSMAAPSWTERALKPVPSLRWPIRILVLGGAYALRVVEPLDYADARLFASGVLAFVFAATLIGRRLPGPVPAPGTVGARTSAALLAAAAVVTIAVPSSERVWGVMNGTGGSLVALHLAPLRPREAIIGTTGEWFHPRDGVESIPPSVPRLMGSDAIVIVITIDALREELLREKKHRRALPELWKLRAESVRFEHARTPSPSTLVSVLAILTGRYYSQLYFTRKEGGAGDGLLLPHEDESIRLADVLGDAGIASTHLMVTSGFQEETGVSRGFTRARFTGKGRRRGEYLMDLLLEELAEVGDDERHFFYLHFMDPHQPYDLAGRRGSPFRRYLGEVSLVDAQIGRLREWIAERGLTGRVTLVVSADHGEAFGEHGNHGHATTVFEELLHVPLLVRVPGVDPRAVSAEVGLIDLAPTVLDLFGCPTPGSFMGQSLVPFLRGRSPQLTRPLVADSGRRMQAMYCEDGLKAMTDLRRNTNAVYDLGADPGELENLAGTGREDVDRCLSRLRTFFDTHTLDRDGYVPPARRF